MPFVELLTDDRGVSPVVGTILMVGIAVILGAVIATFAFGVMFNTGPFNEAINELIDGDTTGGPVNNSILFVAVMSKPMLDEVKQYI